MREPLISVVMPVYNGGTYLIDAVASIIEQTCQDWELICVDDGSNDGSGDLLDWFAAQDPRIRVLHQQNAGIVSALNAGCAAARAPLLCRMDCDDIALLDRLERQTEFLRKHPECVVVGGSILEIDSDGAPLGSSQLPQQHDEIVDGLLNRRTGHFHPTTLIRAEAVRAIGGYREQYNWVEDHDLWLRLSRRGRLANMPDVVLAYRQHASSVCWKRKNQQRELMNDLMRDAYRVRGLQAPSSVLLDAAAERSSAGSGKWARAAAKGGHARSVFKHLGLMNQGSDPWTYKLRMNVEALVRLGLSLVRGLGKGAATKVPNFPDWHRRAEARSPSRRVAA